MHDSMESKSTVEEVRLLCSECSVRTSVIDRVAQIPEYVDALKRADGEIDNDVFFDIISSQYHQMCENGSIYDEASGINHLVSYEKKLVDIKDSKRRFGFLYKHSSIDRFVLCSISKIPEYIQALKNQSVDLTDEVIYDTVEYSFQKMFLSKTLYREARNARWLLVKDRMRVEPLPFENQYEYLVLFSKSSINQDVAAMITLIPEYENALREYHGILTNNAIFFIIEKTYTKIIQENGGYSDLSAINKAINDEKKRLQFDDSHKKIAFLYKKCKSIRPSIISQIANVPEYVNAILNYHGEFDDSALYDIIKQTYQKLYDDGRGSKTARNVLTRISKDVTGDSQTWRYTN